MSAAATCPTAVACAVCGTDDPTTLTVTVVGDGEPGTFCLTRCTACDAHHRWPRGTVRGYLDRAREHAAH